MKQFIADKRLFIRRVFLIILDIIMIHSASALALLSRFDFRISAVEPRYWDAILSYVFIDTIITIFIFFCFRLYHSLWRYAGIDELSNILIAGVLSSFVQFCGLRILQIHVPRSFYPLHLMYLVILVVGTRFLYRFLRIISRKYHPDSTKHRMMIIGAGDAANAIIKEIIGSSYLEGVVVCAIDDNPQKKGSYMQGIKVVGGRDKILESVARYKVTDIIIAMPSVGSQKVKGILDICKETDCSLKILPGMYQLINEEVSVSRLKQVEIEDLLGRESVDIDMDAIMSYVSHKTILVTGGGGSIGSELCRQIAKHNPKRLIIVDIYENNAYEIQQELKLKYPSLDLVVLIASVRNTNRMNVIFKEYRPEIVYHAAAHKHVPLMEDSPNEAIKNNVFGTLKMAKASDQFGVKRFILISTDKAVNPTNIMGASKRICEMIVQAYNQMSKTEFVAVRFGNVLGSNGSVIPLFKKQIAAGGPVTVTHPDIIRYFMTIPEAVTLVLQAGAYAKGGEIFVLDMGEPIKIADLAANLIRLSGYTPGRDITISYTGLRPGEKLYEELLMDEEGLQDTKNKLIHIGKPIKMNTEQFLYKLDQLYEESINETTDIRHLVQEIVPTYVIQEEENNDPTPQ